MDKIADELEAAGHTVYQIPLGASNATGSLGFIAPVEELAKQQQMNIRFDAIIHACSSGGTQAGLEVKKRLLGLDNLLIYGISADNSAEKIKETIAGITYPMINRLGHSEKIYEEELHADDSYVGDRYSISTELSSEVIRHSLSQLTHHRAQLGVYLRLLALLTTAAKVNSNQPTTCSSGIPVDS